LRWFTIVRLTRALGIGAVALTLVACAATTAPKSTTHAAAQAPSKVAQAATLLAQKRPALPGPSATTTQALAPYVGHPVSAFARKNGWPARVPDPSLVGEPLGGAAGSTVMLYYPRQDLWFGAFPDGGHPVEWVDTTGSNYSRSPAKYGAGSETPLLTNVVIFGNHGVAQSRWSSTTTTRGSQGSVVMWSEGATTYALLSRTLDPDQLLAVASTMVIVKP
jgi:hypothetical protein